MKSPRTVGVGVRRGGGYTVSIHRCGAKHEFFGRLHVDDALVEAVQRRHHGLRRNRSGWGGWKRMTAGDTDNDNMSATD